MKNWISSVPILLIGLAASCAATPVAVAHGNHTEDADYHSHLSLTYSYDGGCVYGEYIAVELPASVECPANIALLH